MKPIESPFRYPGGKTWLVPRLLSDISRLPYVPDVYIEPFAGGASVGLAVAATNAAVRIILVETDKNVAAVWRTILGTQREWLAREIVEFDVNRDSVREILSATPRSTRERAFQTLLKNRVSRAGVISQRGGILNSGERGNGVSSRWYPVTLANRIRKIGLLSSRIQFIEADGLQILRRYLSERSLVAYIDPPYTVGGNGSGSRLYDHADVDHEGLFAIGSKMRGVVYFSYDDSAFVRTLARSHGFTCEALAMRDAHHRRQFELLIGKPQGKRRAKT